MKNKINTYNTAAFRERFIQGGQKLDAMLKPDFGKFFIVRVEEMIRLMKLPLAPTKATTHTLMYLTEGTAEMYIGGAFYKIHRQECLVVQAGPFGAIPASASTAKRPVMYCLC